MLARFGAVRALGNPFDVLITISTAQAASLHPLHRSNWDLSSTPALIAAGPASFGRFSHMPFRGDGRPGIPTTTSVSLRERSILNNFDFVATELDPSCN
jgi:hypothetical protein